MEFLNKLPNWFRWVLVPVLTVITFALVSALTALFITIQDGMFGIEDGSLYDRISINIIAAFIIGFTTIYVGVKVSPSERKKVALILGGCGFLVIGFLLNRLLEVGEMWDYISVIFNLIGIGVSVYNAFEQEG
jgi:fluoride ion exporter CrcB/FEX